VEAARASVSAMGSAVLRAAHVEEDAPPWVFEDTASKSLLTDAEVRAIERTMEDWPPEVRAAFRVAHAVRARVAEDVAIDGLRLGRESFVILGAGLDSFAWRHPRAAELAIWEVDHPATQSWKRRALKRIGLDELPNVRFVSVDFAATDLEGIDLPPLATWNWLGVTMYLETSDTVRTLRGIATKHPGSVLVVNFLLAEEERDELATAVQEAANKVLETAREPVLSSYTRREVKALLSQAGFSSVELLAGADLKERYLAGRPDLELPSSTVVAIATV
jgi:methyltransferase (TIGR00027 family)